MRETLCFPHFAALILYARIFPEVGQPKMGKRFSFQSPVRIVPVVCPILLINMKTSALPS